MGFFPFLLLLPVTFSFNIDLYYESLCPDSTRFISDQIPEMWEALGEEITLNLIPYGFAKTTQTTDGWEFQCQHGPRECKGNIIQACTDYVMRGRHLTVPLITCMMSSDSPDQAGPQCFTMYEAEYGEVEECISNGLGDGMHYINGIKTRLANVTNVPWLDIEGHHMAEYWDIEKVGLLYYLCEHFNLAGCA